MPCRPTIARRGNDRYTRERGPRDARVEERVGLAVSGDDQGRPDRVGWPRRRADGPGRPGGAVHNTGVSFNDAFGGGRRAAPGVEQPAVFEAGHRLDGRVERIPSALENVPTGLEGGSKATL